MTHTSNSQQDKIPQKTPMFNSELCLETYTHSHTILIYFNVWHTISKN